MGIPLTRKQRQMVEYIARCLEEQGWPPTLRELARRFGVSIGAVQDHVAALVAKGALRREPGRARGLRLCEAARLSLQPSLPVLGQVPAGGPAEALEDVEGRLTLDKSVAGGADFVLRVKGESMKPELLDGDMVLVRQAAAAENGQIVVARVGQDEATVKRFRRKGGAVFLEPINPEYPPIAREFKVIGRVVGLVRRYGK